MNEQPENISTESDSQTDEQDFALNLNISSSDAKPTQLQSIAPKIIFAIVFLIFNTSVYFLLDFSTSWPGYSFGVLYSSLTAQVYLIALYTVCAPSVLYKRFAIALLLLGGPFAVSLLNCLPWANVFVIKPFELIIFLHFTFNWFTTQIPLWLVRLYGFRIKNIKRGCDLNGGDNQFSIKDLLIWMVIISFVSVAVKLYFTVPEQRNLEVVLNEFQDLLREWGSGKTISTIMDETFFSDLTGLVFLCLAPLTCLFVLKKELTLKWSLLNIVLCGLVIWLAIFIEVYTNDSPDVSILRSYLIWYFTSYCLWILLALLIARMLGYRLINTRAKRT